jgi:hypothetical protein
LIWARVRLDLAIETTGERVGGALEVVAGLEVHPELRLHSEEAGEAERAVGGHGAPAVHEVVNPLHRTPIDLASRY